MPFSISRHYKWPYKDITPGDLGQNMPLSPLVKLKGPRKVETKPALSNSSSTQVKGSHKSTPVKTDVTQDLGHFVFDESAEEIRVSEAAAKGKGWAVNPVYVDSRSKSGSASDESLEELIEAFLTQKKEGEKKKKRGKK